jgi:DNA repair photolyase
MPLTLNPAKGNMYEFVTHTCNPVKGKCAHACRYCYAARCHGTPLRFDRDGLRKLKIPPDLYIFIGSSTDMWAENVPALWVWDVLIKCQENPQSKYLFQTKNPMRYLGAGGLLPLPPRGKGILVATIETDSEYWRNKVTPFAPPIPSRFIAMQHCALRYETQVTIEPILKFDRQLFVNALREIHPNQINIGADSKHHNLPEPSKQEVFDLIHSLQDCGLKVYLKPNLDRILES